jgi:hypothetical protein
VNLVGSPALEVTTHLHHLEVDVRDTGEIVLIQHQVKLASSHQGVHHSIAATPLEFYWNSRE